MSEERKHPSAALSEAALENVSGGSADDSYRRYAEVTFGSCFASSPGNNPFRCEGGAAALVDYVQRYGPLRTWDECPFLKHNGQGR